MGFSSAIERSKAVGRAFSKRVPEGEDPNALSQPGLEKAREGSDVEHASVHDDMHWEPAAGVEQDPGVTKIEALYIVFGKGKGLFFLWLSIGLISYGYALSESTTYTYEAFAASAFGEHSLIGTISVITAIMAGVAKPFVAKLADIFSRPIAILTSVVFYTLGYIIVAAAQNIRAVAAGQVIYTLGNTGISFLTGILMADITSLQWRGAINGAFSLPFVVNAFVAGYISDGISAYSENGWRWGYGMFCIIIPILLAPALIVLFVGDHRAKKLGALSLAAPGYYRRQVLEGREAKKLPVHKMLIFYWRRLNGFGLLLLGFAFACLLSPMTLNATAKGGYKNASMIALLVVGGILFIAWAVWDGFFAEHPIMPRRVFNRTFVACVVIDFFYYFSGYLGSTYFSSWVYVVKNWSARDYNFFLNAQTVGLCGFAVIAGLAQRYFHRYKYQQILGLAIRCIGLGLNYYASIRPTTAVLVCARVISSLGGAVSVVSTEVAAAASVPHQDMAIARAVLSLWTSIGGSIASAIAASVWTHRLPKKLEEYLGDTHDAASRAKIFGSIVVARGTQPRDKVIVAYNEAIRPLLLAALITSFCGLIAGFFAKDFYLGEAHNAVETHKIIKMRSKKQTDPEVIAQKVKEVQERTGELEIREQEDKAQVSTQSKLVAKE